ncbi:transposase [Paenibacillus sp. WQ 127069]|uniref:Transposase n=1 Tax=Paenibacillus baimaensis TaxID=2982185 RepID=A0ABT2U7P5_9BACL|nr:transposase [Paenibacillus sp. WQ 127069]MCU6790652.1 transposase [Paenibacillus sp. WQ 127069]
MSNTATGMQKAAELIAQAKRSVGETTALDEAKQDLGRLLQEFERIVEILDRIEQDMQVLLSEIPMADQLRSIKGLGPIFIAAILSCAGDLRQYAHGRQLLRKASLNLAERMSGKHKGQIMLSKRGDATLRKYMYLATIVLVGTYPVFRQMHENNVQIRQMKKQQSVFKLLGKLARIINGIVGRGETFSPEKAAPTCTRAA